VPILFWRGRQGRRHNVGDARRHCADARRHCRDHDTAGRGVLSSALIEPGLAKARPSVRPSRPRSGRVSPSSGRFLPDASPLRDIAELPDGWCRPRGWQHHEGRRPTRCSVSSRRGRRQKLGGYGGDRRQSRLCSPKGWNSQAQGSRWHRTDGVFDSGRSHQIEVPRLIGHEERDEAHDSDALLCRCRPTPGRRFRADRPARVPGGQR
jgi:hypothetical protein